MLYGSVLLNVSHQLLPARNSCGYYNVKFPASIANDVSDTKWTSEFYSFLQGSKYGRKYYVVANALGLGFSTAIT